MLHGVPMPSPKAIHDLPAASIWSAMFLTVLGWLHEQRAGEDVAEKSLQSDGWPGARRRSRSAMPCVSPDVSAM